MTDSVRLAKHLADLLNCSRKEAGQYIEGGWVRVDGQTIEEPGYRVEPQRKVELAPGARQEDVGPVTFLFHKPAGGLIDDTAESVGHLLSPDARAPDERPGSRFLKKHLVSLRMVTPLETEASGLVVFTQEYGIVRKLVDEAKHLEQEYVVEVAGELIPEGLALLKHGLSWQGKPLAPIKVSWQSETRLRFALKTPPLGLIAYMCKEVGLEVVSMKRIRIGRLPMAGLPLAQWRYRLGYERF